MFARKPTAEMKAAAQKENVLADITKRHPDSTAVRFAIEAGQHGQPLDLESTIALAAANDMKLRFFGAAGETTGTWNYLKSPAVITASIAALMAAAVLALTPAVVTSLDFSIFNKVFSGDIPSIQKPDGSFNFEVLKTIGLAASALATIPAMYFANTKATKAMAYGLTAVVLTVGAWIALPELSILPKAENASKFLTDWVNGGQLSPQEIAAAKAKGMADAAQKGMEVSTGIAKQGVDAVRSAAEKAASQGVITKSREAIVVATQAASKSVEAATRTLGEALSAQEIAKAAELKSRASSPERLVAMLMSTALVGGLMFLAAFSGSYFMRLAPEWLKSAMKSTHEKKAKRLMVISIKSSPASARGELGVLIGAAVQGYRTASGDQDGRINDAMIDRAVNNATRYFGEMIDAKWKGDTAAASQAANQNDTSSAAPAPARPAAAPAAAGNGAQHPSA